QERAALDEEQMARSGELKARILRPDPPLVRRRIERRHEEAGVLGIGARHLEEETPAVGQELGPVMGGLLLRRVQGRQRLGFATGLRYRVEASLPPSGAEDDRAQRAPGPSVEGRLGKSADALDGPAREGELAELSLDRERDRRAVGRPEVPA